MKFKVIIPARYDSSRFPGKVLKLIGGKTMLEHVYNNAKNSQADDVFIATDSDIVYEAASKFTKNIYMTSNNNKNGTERVAELSETLNWLPEDLVINLQADMPELKFDNINLLAKKAFNNRGLSTLYYNLIDTNLLKDKNTVKILVKDKNINFYRYYDGDNIDGQSAFVGRSSSVRSGLEFGFVRTSCSKYWEHSVLSVAISSETDAVAARSPAASAALSLCLRSI